MLLQPGKAPGRPRKAWSSVATPTSSQALQNLNQGPFTKAGSNDVSLNLNHFELLHHYYTSTCDTFSGDPSARQMFRVHLPRMGREKPFLLHLLLALASRHLGFLASDDNKSIHYADLAELHFSIALPQATCILSRLNPENWQVVYLSSLLVCWYIFARGPSPGEYLVFSDHGYPTWLPLLRGVRSIRQTIGCDRLFNNTTLSTAGVDHSMNVDAPTVITLKLPRLNWERSFKELEIFIASTASPDFAEVYLVALARLARNYEATYGGDENGSYNGNPVHKMIFQWLYLMDDKLVDQIQQKDSHALLILANFAVLINLYDLYNCWFLHGWARHILFGIYHSLEDAYRVWMRWPMEAAGIEWTTLD
jgi:hypothetical protein